MSVQPASAIAADVRTGKASAVDTVRDALTRIDAADTTINAFTQVFAERALKDAAAVDAWLASGESLPLAGVPIAIKDNICVSFGRTTCASRMLEHYESPYDATVVRRLTAAGAIVVGKANLDEFAMGSTCSHSAFGPTRNPWDTDRTPGGSSGGSAAAVAAGLCPLSLGSDTGGSIRQPAGFCGVVGLKPTYGRVSRYGLVAFASSLDQIGPFATNTADAALCLNVLAGHDPNDATSAARAPEDFTAALDEAPPHLTIGVPTLLREAPLAPEVRTAFDDAVATFKDAGARIVDVPLPHADYAIAAYYLVAPAEASSNLARYDGVRYGSRPPFGKDATLDDLYLRARSQGFGDEVQRRIMLGTYALSSGYYDAYYVAACKVRRLIKQDYDRAFAGTSTDHPVDAVLMPASPTVAPPIGELEQDPLHEYLADVFTVGANLSGLPGITLPAAWAEVDTKRLPVGVQLIAPAWREHAMLQIARRFEHASGVAWHLPASV